MNEIPHSEEAEKGVVGSLIMDSGLTIRLCKEHGISSRSFFFPAHALMFSTIEDMLDNGKPVDMLTLVQQLEDAGTLHKSGGNDKVMDIVDATPTASHAEYYIGILKEKYRLRRVKEIAEQAIENACDGSYESSDIISDLTSRSVGLIEIKEIVDTSASILEVFEESRSGRQNSIPTPWVGINRKTGGPSKGMETLFTGRSKSGKSMLKSYWQKYLGTQGIPVLDCCFEDRVRIAKTRCASIGQFNASEMLNGGRYILDDGKYRWSRTTDRQMDLAKQCFDEMDKLPMYWFDQRCKPTDLKSKLSEYVDRYGIELAFIDGVKDLQRPSGKYNDTGFDEESSHAITQVASELNIAIVSIHHLTKLDANELIRSANIRGSGNIVSNARLVYALQGDKVGAGLDQYPAYKDLAFDEEGYCTTRVFDCIDNNHGGLASVWLDTDLGRCDFRQM